MLDFWAGLVLAFSFLTLIPMPWVEWTAARTRFLPLLMPVVGLVVGLLGAGLYVLISHFGLSALLSAVLMTLYYTVITGGLSTDGLMDTADAYFSRREPAERLVIMKDSRVGAFGVMACVFLLLLRTGLFYEAFSRLIAPGALNSPSVAGLPLLGWGLIAMPFLSRLGQSFMLCVFPLAKAEGLAATFRPLAGRRYGIALGLYWLLAAALLTLAAGWQGLALPLLLVLSLGGAYFFSKKNFGGITGDILGAFVETTELLLLAGVVFLL
jgi:adenosylcobinamide-GDP ribazoletransferase